MYYVSTAPLTHLPLPIRIHLEETGSREQRNGGSTSRCCERRRGTGGKRRRRGRSRGSGGRAGAGCARGRGRGSGGSRLCDTGHGGHAGGGSGAEPVVVSTGSVDMRPSASTRRVRGNGRGWGELGNLRLGSGTERSHLVLHGRPLVAVRTVVVACQDIGVHVAQADPVVAVLLARVDAALVAAHAGVDNVLGCAVGSEGGRGRGDEGAEEDCRTHVDVRWEGYESLAWVLKSVYRELTIWRPKANDGL